MLSLLLALVTVGVFLPVSRNDFINYDDPDYVTSNPHVQAGITRESVAWALTSGHANNWHPVTWMSHMFDWQVFGGKAAPTHLVSVLLHAINSVLLFCLLHTLTQATWRSWFVAALFAIHPLHVESVAWIAERKDVLSTFFLLLVLGAYSFYVKATGTKRWMAYTLALGFFALGLMSKPMLVTVPFVLLLMDYWPLRRLEKNSPAKPWRGFRRLLAEKTPFLVLSAASSVVTFLMQHRGGAVSANVALVDRVGNALVAYCRYLQKTLWPVDLAVFYPHPGKWPVWQVLLCGLLLACIWFFVYSSRKTKPYLLVGWLWFLGTLVPVIGLVQVGMQSMADRYTYLPLIGVFWAVIWLVNDLLRTRPLGAPVRGFAGAAMLAGCAILTVRQLGYWRNSEALFRHALQVTQNNFLAYNNLGVHLSTQEGKAEEEIACYRRSIEINPDFVEALNNLGSALAAQGRNAEALPFFEAALRQAPRRTELHSNFANALMDLGQLDKALEQYRLVLEASPDNADAHNEIGIALAQKGEVDQAAVHLKEATRLRPMNSSAHLNLGNVYALQKRWSDAAREYGAALRAEPTNEQAHYNLAGVLAQTVNLSAAVTHYREALRLRPENPEALYQLGTVLLRVGQPEAAATSFKEALRLRPNYPEAARQLQLLAGQPK